MAALVDESNSKSSSKHTHSKANFPNNYNNESEKFELSCSMYFTPKGTEEENEFDAIADMLKSSKAMVKAIDDSKLVAKECISLVDGDKSIHIKYKGFNYQIKHKKYELEKEEYTMEAGMYIYVIIVHTYIKSITNTYNDLIFNLIFIFYRIISVS